MVSKKCKPLTYNCLSLLCVWKQQFFISSKRLSSILMTPSSINNLSLVTPMWVLASKFSVCTECTHKTLCTHPTPPTPPPPPFTVTTRKALKWGTLPACNKHVGHWWCVMDGLSLQLMCRSVICHPPRGKRCSFKIDIPLHGSVPDAMVIHLSYSCRKVPPPLYLSWMGDRFI